MKKLLFYLFSLPTLLAVSWTHTAVGQTQQDPQKVFSYGQPAFFRPYDKGGISMFETTKADYDKVYQGRKIYFGAGFTQQLQQLKHQNPGALFSDYNAVDPLQRVNALKPIKGGLMTAQANLNIDVQLADGIRLNLSNYLSSRHHNEFWVKGGYIQFDKLPFTGNLWEQVMRYTTIKVGHMEINYGDDHFRRPDGGQTIYSPFMEGNIMDAFATEVAGEVYVQHQGFFGMVGLSNGMIKGSVDSLPNNSDGSSSASPSIYFKGGVDKSLLEIARLRLTGSWYHNSGTNGSGLTLYNGDRTGSNYQFVMEKNFAATGAPQGGAAMYSSGRFNPDFSGKLDAIMINGMFSVLGAELYGTYEHAQGRAKNEGLQSGETAVKSRKAQQYALQALYRFGSEENLYLGLRHNQVRAELPTQQEKVSIARNAIAAGWFVTDNILLKGEYVQQKYKAFSPQDYRHNGKFNGLVIEAVVGF